MRPLYYCLAPLLLHGCSLWLPSADPSQAWVDLDEAQRDALQARQVDDSAWDDPRYFQVTPGEHELLLSYRFEVQPVNLGSTPGLPRDCEVSLQYADFTAGQRYALKAGAVGFRPWLELRDAQGQVVARGHEQRCGLI